MLNWRYDEAIIIQDLNGFSGLHRVKGKKPIYSDDEIAIFLLCNIFIEKDAFIAFVFKRERRVLVYRLSDGYRWYGKIKWNSRIKYLRQISKSEQRRINNLLEKYPQAVEHLAAILI